MTTIMEEFKEIESLTDDLAREINHPTLEEMRQQELDMLDAIEREEFNQKLNEANQEWERLEANKD